MKKELDCRGLACPAPVLETRHAIEADAPTVISVLLDNEAAARNVRRFLESQGFDVSVSEKDALFYVSGHRDSSALSVEVPEKQALKSESTMTAPSNGTPSSPQKIMVMITSTCMGSGDDELGFKLMRSFLATLNELGDELWRLIFVNSGVYLTIEGSETYHMLEKLEQGGVHILVCGTCLDHFKLIKRHKIGETTNMLDIVTAMQLADKIIKI